MTETVPRLYHVVRSGGALREEAGLLLLRSSKELNPGGATKSGVMVGIGEETQELLDVLYDLAAVGCDIVTIGQYLRPSGESFADDAVVYAAGVCGIEGGSAEDGIPACGVGAAGKVELSRV